MVAMVTEAMDTDTDMGVASEEVSDAEDSVDDSANNLMTSLCLKP